MIMTMQLRSKPLVKHLYWLIFSDEFWMIIVALSNIKLGIWLIHHLDWNISRRSRLVIFFIILKESSCCCRWYGMNLSISNMSLVFYCWYVIMSWVLQSTGVSSLVWQFVRNTCPTDVLLFHHQDESSRCDNEVFNEQIANLRWKFSSRSSACASCLVFLSFKTI